MRNITCQIAPFIACHFYPLPGEKALIWQIDHGYNDNGIFVKGNCECLSFPFWGTVGEVLNHLEFGKNK